MDLINSEFDLRASMYNKLTWVVDCSFIDWFITHLDFIGVTKCLDLGIGTGVIARQVLKRFEVDYWGIDTSQEMLKQIPLPVHGIQGDVASMPFEDATFDLVFARMTLHHVKKLHNCVAEALRVLKPQGRFGICEGVPPNVECYSLFKYILSLKEPRHVFQESCLLNLFNEFHFRNIRTCTFSVPDVSLNNWLENSGIQNHVIRNKLREMHYTAPKHFLEAYRAKFCSDGDMLLTFKFFLIVGEK